LQLGKQPGMQGKFCLVFACLSVSIFTACSSVGGAVSPNAPAPSLTATPTQSPVGKYIKHVVIVIQENRSFENYFAGYPGADAPKWGWGTDGSGQRVKIPLHSVTFVGPDFGHDWGKAVGDWDQGQMDGFSRFPSPSGQTPYAYVQRSLIAPYWTMAHEYVLADHMFPTEFGGSYTAHFDLIAGTDNLRPDLALVDNPTTTLDCDAPPGTKSSTVNAQRQLSHFTGPFPCFNQFKTMANTLDAAGVSWKYYTTGATSTGIWSPFDGIKDVRYGLDWKTKIVVPETKILTDPQKGALASVSWVTPDLKNSDHPMAKSDTGPSWVAGIVNAVGESPYWDSTAIIILWDDWGGWYDNLPPPQRDFRGLGLRVPCLIISPYARAHYVSHTEYEYGSILKFVEEAFGLPQLDTLGRGSGYTDSRANSLTDAFDFTQAPRQFKRIRAPYPPSYLLSRPPSRQPPDYE
jgi:phospholipase C